MPDRVWSHQEVGKTWLATLSSRVLLASPVKCPILEKYKMLANYLDTKTPRPLLPQWVGFFYKPVCTWPGEGNRTFVSCVWAVWSAGQCHWRACPAPLRWMANPIFLSYVSLIFVNLVLGIFFVCLFLKRNIYNWIALQWKQLGMLELMPAVNTALSRQPPFIELALGNKQAFNMIKDQKPG